VINNRQQVLQLSQIDPPLYEYSLFNWTSIRRYFENNNNTFIDEMVNNNCVVTEDKQALIL